MDRRERQAELLVGVGFLLVASALAGLAGADREWDTLPALVLVLAFALGTRIQLDVGAGYTVPTQLVFVPMLLLLPTPDVPLLVAAGWALGKLPDVIERSVHPERLLVALGNSWYAVGPALVLVAFDAQTPDWDDWPVYVLAVLAQFGTDFAASAAREWLGRGVELRVMFGVLRWVYLIDLLLTGPALLAAFASRDARLGFLPILPAALLFVLFGRERSHRLADALTLAERSEQAADLAAALLESERETTRVREDVLAGASAQVLTPLGRMTALVYRLRREDGSELELRLKEMEREISQLRHDAGQFIDYSLLKAGRELPVEPRRTELAPIVRGAAAAYRPDARVSLELPERIPAVLADDGRLMQILMALLSNAVKFSPDRSPVLVRVRVLEDTVEVAVADEGPGISQRDLARIFEEMRRGSAAAGTEGAGLGLYLCRLLAEAMGADLRVHSRLGEGSTFTLVLPLA
jgi:signal transduction histidine kinase